MRGWRMLVVVVALAAGAALLIVPEMFSRQSTRPTEDGGRRVTPARLAPAVRPECIVPSERQPPAPEAELLPPASPDPRPQLLPPATVSSCPQ